MDDQRSAYGLFEFTFEDFSAKGKAVKWKKYKLNEEYMYTKDRCLKIFNTPLRSLNYDYGINFTVFYKIKLVDKIDDINKYFNWLNSGAKTALLDLFVKYSHIMGESAEEWYKFLKVTSISIKIDEYGIISSAIGGEDRIGRYHGEGLNLFEIQTKREKVTFLLSQGFGLNGRVIELNESSEYVMQEFV
jgi:hypothetical protein